MTTAAPSTNGCSLTETSSSNCTTSGPSTITARSLTRFVGGFEERVGTAMERGAVALKSIAASRGGLWLFTESSQADRRRGEQGPGVRRIQEWLSLSGFSVAMDGDFGAATDCRE